MKFEKTSTVSHPRSEVHDTMMEHMEKVLPLLPNIEAIEMESRRDADDGIHIVRRWQGKSTTVPAALRPFLSRELIAWTDRARWLPQQHRVEWVQTSCAAHIAKLYDCTGTTAFEPDPSDPEHATCIRISGDLQVHPKNLPGMPKLLASKLAPQIEKFVIDLITTNLSDVSDALQRYLDGQHAKKPRRSKPRG